MRVRPTILSAAALGLALLAAPAHAQTPAAPETTAATPAPPPGRLTLSPRDVTVVGSATFRVGRDLYRVAGIRAPRANRGACLYERLRGREARKQLVRLLRNGPIVVTPTGVLNPRQGVRLAEVSVRGRSVAQALIAGEVALPVSNSARNPWCLGGARSRG